MMVVGGLINQSPGRIAGDIKTLVRARDGWGKVELVDGGHSRPTGHQAAGAEGQESEGCVGTEKTGKESNQGSTGKRRDASVLLPQGEKLAARIQKIIAAAPESSRFAEEGGRGKQ